MEIQKVRSEHELKLAEVQGQGAQREQADNAEVNGAEDNPRQNNGSRSMLLYSIYIVISVH